VLKSFRVLRLLKMFRYMESLRLIGEVLMGSASSFMAIAVLIVLFMVVFSIVGLHIFGGIFPPTTVPNFNSFVNAFILVFQVWRLLYTGRSRLYCVARPRFPCR
jgi:hypothetical protein